MRHPRHSIAHIQSDSTSHYMVTAACFEHKPVIGRSPQRMAEFEASLTRTLTANCRQVTAWIVLPNHYHLIVDTADIGILLTKLGQLHGRTSYYWNTEEQLRGRQVWCNSAETAIKSERHFYATLNYVMHNAVHHGYVSQWTDWPYCNARQYLAEVGRHQAIINWTSYPVYDFGKSWDPAEL
jgi:putative transposase